MFHEVKGKNVIFDRERKQAAWTPIQSGGLTFTSRPLSVGDPVTLTLEGTGAIELGITTVDPATLADDTVPDSANHLQEYHFLNDVKIHKRKCAMNIHLDEETREVISSYGGGHYKQAISLQNRYFLVAEVKYGAVDMKMECQDDDNVRYEFSENHGRNIKRLNNPAQTTSLTKSPAALCFCSEPLSPKFLIRIACTPKAYQSTIPGRYYLLLRYTKMDPREFSIRNPGKFDIRKAQEEGAAPWSQIEKLEKEECTGHSVNLKFTGEAIEIRSATGKRKRTLCHLGMDEKVWLALELYGISVRLEEIDLPSAQTDPFNIPDIPEEGAVEEVDASVFQEPSVPLKVEAQPFTSGPTVVDPVSTLRPIEDPVHLRESIQRNFIELKSSFTPNEFIDHMYQHGMLTHQELMSISSESPNMMTKVVLLNILSKRPVSKKAFIKALRDTRQDFLIEKFFPTEGKD